MALISWRFVSLLKHVHILVKEHRDYFSLHFINQRQASPLTRGDQCGCLHTLSKTQCLSTETTLVSPFRQPEKNESDDTPETTLVSIWSTRGKRARWRAKTSHGYPHPFAIQRQSNLIAHWDNSWSSAPWSSRDGKFDDTQRPIWSSAPFIEDSMFIDRGYFSLPLSSRDGKSDDMQRPTWSTASLVEGPMSIDWDY